MHQLLRQTESKLRDLIKSEGTICVGLLDSENMSPLEAAKIAARVEKCGAKAILVGGSTAVDQIELEDVVKTIKGSVTSPVILFPGNVTGVSPSADAIFFSCLMNSDNPYFITEAQALGALAIRKYDLEAIPMAYLIVGDGGAAGFVGRAKGIPPHKPGLAAMYALAAQYFGMRFLYLEAGSGVDGRVSQAMIAAVRKVYEGTLIVGGGITTPEAAKDASRSGADIVVIGTMLESKDFDSTLINICKIISHK
ncbi:MAG: geranylgeranylglyceryl/heptaprenylglyceryl phosphate synthase [Nitrososphaerales archaeon]